jgi:hypothetical protein
VLLRDSRQQVRSRYRTPWHTQAAAVSSLFEAFVSYCVADRGQQLHPRWHGRHLCAHNTVDVLQAGVLSLLPANCYTAAGLSHASWLARTP